MSTTDRRFFVYRYFDADGGLLYIGCTNRPRTRFSEHKSSRPQMTARVTKVRMQGPYPRPLARAIERDALTTEQPEFGMTPQRQARRQRLDAQINRRADALAASGMNHYEATRVAVAEFADASAAVDIWQGAAA